MRSELYPPLDTRPFWTQDYPRPTDLPVAGLPATTDVLIVGSGVTGLSAARRLAGAGAEATVVDAGPVGAGASTVNGGMVIYGLKVGTKTLLHRYGSELGRELWEASLRSVDVVEEIVAAEGIQCSFSRPGSAELGSTARDWVALEAETAWMQAELGFHLELIPQARLRSEVVGSDRFVVAAVDSVSAGLHPARYTYGLASALGGAAVRLVENAEVVRVEAGGGSYRVGTTRGEVSAGQVLIATNGYTGPVLPRLRRGVVPVGSYVVVTDPLRPDVAERLIPGNRMLWTSRRLLNYFRRTPDDRLLLGGRQNLRTDLDLHRSARELRRRVVEIFPELEEVRFAHSWTGRLGVTFDLMPHIGRLGGMWYALGYSGHGVGIGTYLGNEVAGLMSGELERSPFADISHPTRWYYRRRPWFLPIAAWWYRLLDAIGR